MELRLTKTIILNEGDPEQKRQEILNYYHRSVEIEEKLFEPFKDDETYYLRADPLRHPLIFYFGHTAAFYINKLFLAKLIDKRINPRFESMFAVGVDEMSWDDLNQAHYDWPKPSEVAHYRLQVRELVGHFIQTHPLEMPINWHHDFWVIMMGIEHSRIHLETSSVLIRQLPLKKLNPHPFWAPCPHSHSGGPANQLLPVSGGTVTLGKNREHPLYGWDNEYGHHSEEITSFKASQYLVSNEEFREFVEDRGYQNQQWWTEEGWGWRNYKKSEHPFFWKKEGNDWKLRIMLENISLPGNWPVEVNYLEAKAFCHWKSAKTGKKIRLPTEVEWYHLYNQSNIPDQPFWTKAPGNINLEHYTSSCPVDEFRFGDFYDVIGNVWQWTETPIAAFEGFKTHPFYDDFSVPTFDNKHNLIKGGSWISTGNEATKDSRYAFRRHFFQHAGFRYIESPKEVTFTTGPSYETDEDLCCQLEAHLGDGQLGKGNFYQQLAKLCLEVVGDKRQSAMDIGCGIGRTSLELSQYFEKVTGLDLSTKYFRLAVELMEKGKIQYVANEEGEIQTYHSKRLEDFSFAPTSSRATFYQADANNLAEKFRGQQVDLLLVQNLDSLRDPEKFLLEIHQLLTQSGTLAIVSSYLWDKKKTQREKWIGGFRKDGENFWTHEALKEILENHFTSFTRPVTVPLVYKKDARHYDYQLPELSFWHKK